MSGSLEKTGTCIVFQTNRQLRHYSQNSTDFSIYFFQHCFVFTFSSENERVLTASIFYSTAIKTLMLSPLKLLHIPGST